MGELIRFQPKNAIKTNNCSLLKTAKIEQKDTRLQPTQADERLVLKSFRKKCRCKIDKNNRTPSKKALKKHRTRMFEAIGMLEDYTEKYKAGSAVYKKLGEAYMYFDQIEMAEPNFKKALDLNPKNLSIYLKLSDYYYDQSYFEPEMLEKSEYYLRRALEYHAFHARLHFELAKILSQSDSQKSFRYAERSRELAYKGRYRISKNDKIDIDIFLVDAYEKNQEYKKVINMTTSLHELGCIDEDTCNARANAYHKLGKSEKAVKWYNEALKYSEDDAYIMFSLAMVYEDIGNFKKAYEYMENTKDIVDNYKGLRTFNDMERLETRITELRYAARHQQKREMKKNSPPMKKDKPKD